MSKTQEALKLALEAWDAEDFDIKVFQMRMENCREALAEQPAQQQDIFECDVQARPLSYPLRDYHRAMSEGPLHYTWTDKPHRLVYDLIAAVKYYAAPQQPAQQEPVAWMDGYRNIYSLEEKAAGCVEATIALVPMANQEKTSGSPINELQCVCGAVWLGEEMVHLPDKRPPASKPWVELTPEEVTWLCDTAKSHEQTWGMFARAIEAKLREKNA